MKDTSNLFSHDVWSGTEYTEKTNVSTSWGMNLISSNNWSDIGEKSLKIIPTSTDSGIRYRYNGTLANKTVTCKATLKTTGTQNITVLFRELDVSNKTINSASTSFRGEGEVTLSLQSGTKNTSFYLQLSSIPLDEQVYIDNIRLTSS